MIIVDHGLAFTSGTHLLADSMVQAAEQRELVSLKFTLEGQVDFIEVQINEDPQEYPLFLQEHFKFRLPENFKGDWTLVLDRDDALALAKHLKGCLVLHLMRYSPVLEYSVCYPEASNYIRYAVILRVGSHIPGTFTREILQEEADLSLLREERKYHQMYKDQGSLLLPAVLPTSTVEAHP